MRRLPEMPETARKRRPAATTTCELSAFAEYYGRNDVALSGHAFFFLGRGECKC